MMRLIREWEEKKRSRLPNLNWRNDVLFFFFDNYVMETRINFYGEKKGRFILHGYEEKELIMWRKWAFSHLFFISVLSKTIIVENILSFNLKRKKMSFVGQDIIGQVWLDTFLNYEDILIEIISFSCIRNLE